ncbi:uncharacterized protein BO96DRAFT_104761 [Aspergillus niger CBS 101883]|uniref:uncharacterized protein n=1 Tax=Aspergillus lacticoffeatus (strain CBS 101883) TaxID=1450533 RepID=UPI000D803FCA|nr:uncharacterized protein BO96DRAFT_104761 [Aspergillus niger CBS 101883]PYH54765.1 hypothetical protein BO96DRAFT_104761 [Aspergillus niger CBS 101883]
MKLHLFIWTLSISSVQRRAFTREEPRGSTARHAINAVCAILRGTWLPEAQKDHVAVRLGRPTHGKNSITGRNNLPTLTPPCPTPSFYRTPLGRFVHRVSHLTVDF